MSIYFALSLLSDLLFVCTTIWQSKRIFQHNAFFRLISGQQTSSYAVWGKHRSAANYFILCVVVEFKNLKQLYDEL